MDRARLIVLTPDGFHSPMESLRTTALAVIPRNRAEKVSRTLEHGGIITRLSEKQSERQVTDFTNVQRFGRTTGLSPARLCQIFSRYVFPHNDLAFC